MVFPEKPDGAPLNQEVGLGLEPAKRVTLSRYASCFQVTVSQCHKLLHPLASNGYPLLWIPQRLTDHVFAGLDAFAQPELDAGSIQILFDMPHLEINVSFEIIPEKT